MTEPEAAPLPEPPSKEELKRAIKAFKKRLKLTRLDDESKIGGFGNLARRQRRSAFRRLHGRGAASAAGRAFGGGPA